MEVSGSRIHIQKFLSLFNEILSGTGVNNCEGK
jgi:hypothetical protein